MKSSFSLILLSLSIYILLTMSCATSVDIEAEISAIEALMDDVTEAHFTGDAEQFYLSNYDKWYDVRQGQIQQVEKEVMIEGTQNYLDDMEFLEVSALDKPVIEVSDDGSLATYLASALVRGYFQGKPVFWVFAWQSVLKKFDGDWRIVSTANTQASPETNVGVLMEKVKSSTGWLSDSSSIYAMAQCTGPTGTFKTLLFSSPEAGRMEQASADGHVIFKHGNLNSWFQDIAKQRFQARLDTVMQLFVVGHEFHWLSLRPEDRLHKPIFKGVSNFADEEAFQVEWQDALGRPVYLYYSFEDYLPLGYEFPSGPEAQHVRVQFSNWLEEGGIKVFQQAVIEEGAVDWRFDFTHISIDSLQHDDFESREKLIF